MLLYQVHTTKSREPSLGTTYKLVLVPVVKVLFVYRYYRSTCGLCLLLRDSGLSHNIPYRPYQQHFCLSLLGTSTSTGARTPPVKKTLECYNDRIPLLLFRLSRSNWHLYVFYKYLYLCTVTTRGNNPTGPLSLGQVLEYRRHR